MNIASDIKNIDAESASGIALLFISVLSPGFLTVFLFKRDLFISLDTLKLIILSISIAAPGVIVPYIVSAISDSIDNNLNVSFLTGKEKSWFYNHSFNNAINMYLIIFVSYLWSWTFSWFSIAYLVSIIFLILVNLFSSSRLSKSRENQLANKASGAPQGVDPS